MTTIGDVAVKLGLDSKEFIKQIDKAENECKQLEKNLNETKESFDKMSKAMALSKNPTKEMSKAFDELKNTLKKEQGAFNEFQGKLNKFNGGLTKSTSAVSMLQGALGKIVTAGAIVALGKQMIHFSSESVKAFREQDRAIKSLNTSLANAGVYTSDYSKHIQQLASDLQNLTNYGDEAIERSIGLGQAYSGNIKLTDELIRATVDYAAATETDLQTAFTLVGKSIGTGTNALARYGVNLDQSMSKEQKMAVITETLAQRFSGSAGDMADKSVQLKNAVGDLSEEIGEVLNPAVEACQSVLIKFVNWLKESIKSIRAFLAEAAIATSEANKKMAAGMQKEAQYYTDLAAKEMKRAEALRAKGQIARADAVQRRAESYLKHAEEFDKASERRLAHAEELKKKEESINVKNNTYKNTGKKVTTSSSGRIEEAKKEIEEYAKLEDFIKKYKEAQSEIAIKEQAQESLGGFLGSFTVGYQKRLEILQWYLKERETITQTHFKTLAEQQEAFNQLEQTKIMQEAQMASDIWTQRGQDIAGILNKTFSTMLTNYGDFSDNMKQLAINLSTYFAKELSKEAFTWLLNSQQQQGGIIANLMNMFTNLSGSLTQVGQAGHIAATGVTATQTAQTALQPIQAALSATTIKTATDYIAQAAAAQQLAAATAQLAISQAALSVAKIPFVGGFLAPAAAAATGAGIAAAVAMVSAASLFSKVGSIGGGLKSVLPSHHSGGIIPGTKEQVAVLQGGERVLNRSEANSYNNGDNNNSQGTTIVNAFNIKAWDGKDVIDTLKANAQTINQIVSSGIKNNNQGLRTIVQNI